MRKEFLPYGLHQIDDGDIKEVVDVLKGSWITTGPKIGEFEKAVADYSGVKHGVAVNSGTSALDIAVGALDLGEGEVITTPFTFVATANSILYNNLKPVFADIDRETYNINPESIKEKITDKTRAIIFVDYAGQPCDMDEIREIAETHGLRLIDDACHGIGGKYKGKKLGNFADITTFSFHPVKHITTGEGGMCVTDDSYLAERMRVLRNHGIDKDVQKRFGPDAGYAYDMKWLGRNYRMTDFQAALGTSQLKKLDGFIRRREEIVAKYNEAFESVDGVTTPTVKANRKSAHHLYTILLDRSISRDKFFQGMRALNIGVNVHYIPVYHHSYYRKLMNISPADYPVTEDVFSRIITLPLHQGMTGEDVDYVIDSMESVLGDVE